MFVKLPHRRCPFIVGTEKGGWKTSKKEKKGRLQGTMQKKFQRYFACLCLIMSIGAVSNKTRPNSKEADDPEALQLLSLELLGIITGHSPHSWLDSNDIWDAVGGNSAGVGLRSQHLLLLSSAHIPCFWFLSYLITSMKMLLVCLSIQCLNVPNFNKWEKAVNLNLIQKSRR